jgi:uncharacterized DUF497 family protein
VDVDIYLLEWDESNETKLADHGITPWELHQMLSNRHVTADNPRGGEGRILLIGETNGGRLLTVSLQDTNDPAVWRPVTGWDSSDGERSLFQRYTA